MSSSLVRRLLAVTLLLTSGSAVVNPAHAAGEDKQMTRKLKTKVAPVYPEIARRMNISGTVKLIVVVAPNGAVKSTKVLGGHPLLVTAAEEAVRKWRFEPAPDEDSGLIELNFKPEN